MEIHKVELKVIPSFHYPKTFTIHIKYIYIILMDTYGEISIIETLI